MIDSFLWNKLDLIISICLVIVSFYLLKKFFIYNKSTTINEEDDIQSRMNIDRRSLRPSYARFMRRKLQEDLDQNPYLCVICWNERKNIVLLPCRHLCVCSLCRTKLCEKTCPICRKKIENFIEVFV